jgi:nicotinamidase-related amidase
MIRRNRFARRPSFTEPSPMITLNPETTALMLIDLQNGILGRKLEPIPAEELVERGEALARRFRAEGALVVPVNVAPVAEEPARQVDAASPLPKILPHGFIDLAPGLAEPGDLRITKKTWGAFSVPELDRELRERGVRTIALGGVATEFGVESTARQAWELGYELVVVRDATTSLALESHQHSMRRIFPRIARITDSDALAFSGL